MAWIFFLPKISVAIYNVQEPPEKVRCTQVREEDSEEAEETYAYTYEQPTKWTPFNSNLTMHGIKVGCFILQDEFQNFYQPE